ncbi:MAG: COX15/CtaA family protein [Candidatus Elarobacter sp.]
MRTFRGFVVAGLIVAFGLAMLGSWTRINNAGMTCPDWPLCRGAVVPVLHGGVVLEWMHRLLAFCETFIVAAVVITGLRLRSAIPALSGMLIALAAVFVLQVLLGGATIFLANSPLSVMFHWGAAMLLLTALTSIAVVAFAFDARQAAPTFAWRRGTVALLIATGWAFATMCAGAFVSSSGAGLACLSVPGCGPGFFGQTVPQALQMSHRLLAVALAVFGVAAAVLLPRTRWRATVAVRVALVLVTLQITLGVLNVVWALPTALREAHAANAIATFLCFVTATVFASLEVAHDPLLVRSASQTPVRGNV